MKRSIYYILLVFTIGLGVHCYFVPDAPLLGDRNGAPLHSPMVSSDSFSIVIETPDNIVVATPKVFTAQVANTTDVPANEESQGFLIAHWKSLLVGLMGFIELIVRLTPSDRDNSIFNFIKTILDALIPNRRDPAGTHP
jgi:hypothetical protein